MIPVLRFREIYKDIPSILSIEPLLYSPVEGDKDFFHRIHSKLFRLNNIYTVVNKEGERVKFVMNEGQHIIYSTMVYYNRVILLKSRQVGGSTLGRILSLDDILTLPTRNNGIVTHNKDSSMEFIEAIRGTRDNIEPDILKIFNCKPVKDNRESIAYDNGSRLTVATSFRSSTLHRLLVSELGELAESYPERANQLLAGTLNSISVKMPILIESTARGDNMFKRLYYKYVDLPDNQRTENDFYPLFISWLDDTTATVDKGNLSMTEEEELYFYKLERSLNRKIGKNKRLFWISKMRSLDNKSSIYQEYPSTADEAFSVGSDHSYYGHFVEKFIEANNRVQDNMYNPSYHVYAAMDLGVKDNTVIIFYQYIMGTFRIIGDYKNTGQEIMHYINEIRSRYDVKMLFLPHDSTRRSLSSVDGIDIIVARTGMPTKVIKRMSREVGIQHVRSALSNMYLDTTAEYSLACLKNYRKELDKKTKEPTGKPLHDTYSDGADAIRYMVASQSQISDTPKIEETKQEDNWEEWQ